MSIKIATVFGGAMEDKTTKEYLDTIQIGKILAQNNYTVVNGGYRGIMEAVSKGATENGGTAVGVTCKSFGYTKGNDYLTYTVTHDDIYDRLRRLIDDSDIYIFQRGGVGTLSELFLAMDVIRKRNNKQPIILVGSFWNTILESLKSTILGEKELSLLTVIEDYNDIKNYL